MKTSFHIGLITLLLLLSYHISFADSSAPRNNRPPAFIASNYLDDIYAAQQEERGFIGNIIANMFANTGRVRSSFIDAFNNLTSTADMRIPYWNEGFFQPGSIQDNGNTIGIGMNPDSIARVSIDGLLNVDGPGYFSGNARIIGNTRIDGNIGLGRAHDDTNRLRVNGNVRIDGATRLNGTARIDGTLDMRNNRIFNLGNATSGGDAVSRSFGDSRYVRTSGNQTIGGTKTFSSGQIIINGGEYGAIGQGGVTDSLGNTANSDDMWIRTRFRSSSGSNNLNTVFRDAGGITMYGPNTSGIIFNINNSGVITTGSVPAARLTGTIANGNLPSNIVRTSRTISSGTWLNGGGNLSTDRTINFQPQTNNWLNDNQGNPRLYLGNTSATSNILLRLSRDDGRFEIRDTANTVRFRIQNGSITVGSVPAARLTGTIADARIPSNIVRDSRAITTAAGSGLTGGGNLSINRSLSVDSTVLRTTGSQTKSGNLWFNGGTRYIGTTSNNNFIIRTNNSNRLTITNNGNVGIGTTSPTQRLHVAGNIALSGGNRFVGTTSDNHLYLRTNNSNRITILNNGNVGIGTSPSGNNRLHVLGDIRLQPGPNSSVYLRTHSDGGPQLTFDSGYTFHIRPHGSGNVTINAGGGNVGIGTISPSQRLDVNGKIRMRSQTSSGDSADTVATKGYVDSVAGGSSLSCVTRQSQSGYSAGVQCQSNEIMTGGGCSSSCNNSNNCGDPSLLRSFPSANGWSCQSFGDTLRAYARCCR